MELTREALQYLVSLGVGGLHEINGETYSENPLERIPPHKDRPKCLDTYSLDAIIKLVKTELVGLTTPIFVQVLSPRKVAVFNTLDDYMGRDDLYRAVFDGPEFRGDFRDQQTAIIWLQSLFVPDENIDYILSLISSLTKKSEVHSDDNGVSQAVTAKQGVALLATVQVKPRVILRPFRTFREVEQPASEFLLRVNEALQIGLFEADGGMWQMAAKDNIAAFLEEGLAEVIEAGQVVVLR